MFNFFGLRNSNYINADVAKKELETDKNIVLVDVRTRQEYNSGHIPDSLLIPLNQLANKIEKKIPEKDCKIFVYCASGARSASAVRILSKIGYTNVYNLGGITSWPYEIV